MVCLSQAWVLVLHLHLALSIDGEVDMPGEVVLGGLLAVQQYVDGTCTKLNYESVQTNEAVRWFFRQLNDRNYIPNVTLGFHAFKTCGQDEKAVAQTIKLMDKYIDRQGPQLFAILGPEYSTETQAVSRLLSSLPEQDRLLQISFSATAAILSDKRIYKNLYRVIETDDVQVDVILKLMEALNWNYVGIMFDSDTYGQEAAYALKASAEVHDICVPVFLPIDLGLTNHQQKSVFDQLVQNLGRSAESPVLALVFIGRGETAKNMFKYLQIHLGHTNFQMIVSESLGLDETRVRDSNGDVIPRTKGLLTPSPPHYDVELFSRFWTDLHSNMTLVTNHVQDNDWLRQYLQEITECQIPLDQNCMDKAKDYNRNDKKLRLYIHYALRGAAAFAKTIKEIHSTECAPNAGLCDQMRGLLKLRMISKMEQINVNTTLDFQQEFENVNLTFDFEKGEIFYVRKDQPTYVVFNLRDKGNIFGFYKVGEFTGDKLHITDDIVAYDNKQQQTHAVQAQCQPEYDCKMCVTTDQCAEILYIPGDFYIIGMAAIHMRNTIQKYGSVDHTSAMQFAVSSLNTKSGIFSKTLGNKSVGLVVIDTCSSPFRIQEQIINLNNGDLRLGHGTNSADILDKIIGYVGPSFSFVAVPLSPLMTEIRKVFISFSATTPTLSVREDHPYFMRTCSPDHKQAKVIMELAKVTGSKYVQIIFSNEEYGIAGKEALLDAAQKQEICVAQSIEAQNTDDPTKHKGYISSLRRYRYAKVVIVFALPSLTRLVMENLYPNLEGGEFAFIGGESWGQIVELLTPKLLGSFTIVQKLPDIKAFTEHFKTIDIEQSVNTWPQDYIEDIEQCYFPKSFQKYKRQKCLSTKIDASIQPDPWSSFVVYTIYSLVLGFHEATTSVCGDVVICSEFSTTGLIAKLKDVKLDMYQNGDSINVFDDNGDGNLGYIISQISVDNGFVYKEVGYSTEKGIVLSTPLQELLRHVNFTSDCPNEVECRACKQQFVTVARLGSESDVVIFSLVAGVCVMGLVVLVMSGCLCHRCCRRKQQEDPYSTIH
ncbi:uncharacterized protein LOC124144462 [Haliotis rufescens]|uniref:uncharacterized protein LOC124144462 n=1 Tax=Haliotis rufescens TaxID=6454 RepID=UPI00201E9E7C|nr:uncharacterized protein LOC124144462 [Haliotis rufescens]XP_048243552.1 uncharacterized protein LOC124144462 [Haliotis rufescens]